MRDIRKKAKKKENYIERENGWDERFYLGKMRDYTPIEKSLNLNKRRKQYNLDSNLKYLKSQIKSSKRRNSNPKYSNVRFASSRSGNYGNITLNNNNYHPKTNYNNDDDLINITPYINNEEFSFIKTRNHEELNIYINNLWDSLGVLKEYKNAFYNIINSLGSNNEAKNQFFQLEIENLKKFENNLIKLNKEIENREKALNFLKKLNDVFETQFINLKLDIPDNMFKDFTKTIQNIRLISINVILLMNKIREICSYSTINGKFDIDKLTKYNFDKNYLIKMRNDLDFLVKSQINNYKGMKINFLSSDPFLISVNNTFPIIHDNFIIIRQCQYIIMQDVIFYQINNNENEKKENKQNNNRYNNIVNHNQSNKSKNKIIIDYNDKNDYDYEHKIDDKINRLKKKLEPIKKESKNNIVEYIQKDKNKKDDNSEKSNKYLKNSDFEDDLIKNNDNDIFDDEIEDEIENQKKEIAKIKKEDEERKLKIKKVSEDNKIINELRELQREKKEKEKRRKEMEELRKKEEEEIKKKKEEEEIKKKKEEEEIKKKKEEEEIKKKKEEEEIKKKKEEEEDGGKELRDSILNTSKYPNSRLNDSLRRSMTPETLKKKKIDNCNFSFFTGNIRDFIPIYNNYFESISENQKIIFNLKSNDLENIQKYFTPKIILCSDKKNKSIIKGVCIISFIFENNNIKVYINHLSSNDENERDNILSYFISFIKQHIDFDEIIIDLYYKYNEELKKFSIDNEIRDLFKINLKFKWIKLENLSNHIRYQKMSLKIDKNEILENVGFNNITVQKLIPDKLFDISDNCYLSFNTINEHNNIENKEFNLIYDKYINLFSIVSIFCQMKNGESYEFNNFKEKYKFIFETKKKLDDLNISNYINLKMNDVNMDSSFNNFSKDSIIHTLNIHISPIFNSTISTIINDYIYNRIECNEMKILFEKNLQIKFYLIPTQDEHISIIISEVNPNLKNIFFNNNSNIYDIFNGFYQNLTNAEENNSNKIIYIPSFNIESKLFSKEINCFKDIQINKNGENYKLDAIEENIKIEYKSDPNREYGFTININEKENIIKDNFIISIVNYDILSNLSLPSIILYYITKDNWNKINK